MRLTFLMFLAGILVVQAQDSALCKTQIPFEQLRFQSVYERELFTDLYAEIDVDFLAFFISADSSGTQEKYADISKKIKMYCQSKADDGLKKLSQKKQIKLLYKEVHSVYLEKYEYQNSFVSIFKDGMYNCVSGSALFARVFDELGISYAIQEFPSHVMLIAFADGDEIAVEATDPTTGYLAFTPKMKVEYADYLRENKLISEAEYLEGPDAVFEKNYLVNKVINFRQLAGIQYSNNAVYAFEKQSKSAQALDFSLKAFKLYPSQQSLLIVLQSVTTIIESKDVSDSLRIRCFALGARFRGEIITDDYLKGHFGDIAATKLIAQRDTQLFGKAYRALVNNSNDSAFNRDISLIYNYEMGRFYGLNSQFNQSVNYFLPAFALDSTNLEISALTIQALFSWLGEFDLKEGLEKLDSVLVIYPGLAQKPSVKIEMADGYLRMFWRGYNNLDGKIGDLYRLKFENLVRPESFKKFKIDRDKFANAYTEAAIYYYKKGQYKKVQDILNKALTMDPDNYRIKDSLVRFR